MLEQVCVGPSVLEQVFVGASMCWSLLTKSINYVVVKINYVVVNINYVIAKLIMLLLT